MMAQRGELPGFNVREQWRFWMTRIDVWSAWQLHRKSRDDKDEEVEP